jgi:hypothetical protein
MEPQMQRTRDGAFRALRRVWFKRSGRGRGFGGGWVDERSSPSIKLELRSVRSEGQRTSGHLWCFAG